MPALSAAIPARLGLGGSVGIRLRGGLAPRTRSLLALACALALTATGGRAAKLMVRQGLVAERLLGAATAAQRGVRPGPALSGTKGNLAIGSGNRIHVLPAGRWIDLGAKAPITGLGAGWTGPLVVQGRTLGWIQDGKLKTLATLPEDGMRMVTRSDGIGLLLFGGSSGDGRSIYHVLQKGQYERLVEAYSTVTAVTERDGDVLFALGAAVFALPLAGEPILLYRHPEPIFSMATDPQRSTVYLASGTGVFSLTAKGAEPVLGGATGFLHHDGTTLMVSDPFRREVLAVRPAPSRAGSRPTARNAPPGKPGGGKSKPGTKPPPATKDPLPTAGGLDFLK